MIHHVQLACPPGSEDTLRGFYGRVLGLQEVAKPPVLAARGGCWFRGHGIELHLGVEHPEAGRLEPFGCGGDMRGGGLRIHGERPHQNRKGRFGRQFAIRNQRRSRYVGRRRLCGCTGMR